jgi:hypothetical protein
VKFHNTTYIYIYIERERERGLKASTSNLRISEIEEIRFVV